MNKCFSCQNQKKKKKEGILCLRKRKLTCRFLVLLADFNHFLILQEVVILNLTEKNLNLFLLQHPQDLQHCFVFCQTSFVSFL